MQKIALSVVLLAAVICWAAPNANDYPITVHVSSSRLVEEPESPHGSRTVQVLHVVINGKKYELRAREYRYRLLELGDYKARLSKDQHKTSYESYQVYEFLLPDQTTREFTVVGQSE